MGKLLIYLLILTILQQTHQQSFLKKILTKLSKIKFRTTVEQNCQKEDLKIYLTKLLDDFKVKLENTSNLKQIYYDIIQTDNIQTKNLTKEIQKSLKTKRLNALKLKILREHLKYIRAMALHRKYKKDYENQIEKVDLKSVLYAANEHTVLKFDNSDCGENDQKIENESKCPVDGESTAKSPEINLGSHKDTTASIPDLDQQLIQKQNDGNSIETGSKYPKFGDETPSVVNHIENSKHKIKDPKSNEYPLHTEPRHPPKKYPNHRDNPHKKRYKIDKKSNLTNLEITMMLIITVDVFIIIIIFYYKFYGLRNITDWITSLKSSISLHNHISKPRDKAISHSMIKNIEIEAMKVEMIKEMDGTPIHQKKESVISDDPQFNPKMFQDGSRAQTMSIGKPDTDQSQTEKIDDVNLYNKTSQCMKFPSGEFYAIKEVKETSSVEFVKL